MKSSKFQRGWIWLLPALVAAALTAMVGVPLIQHAQKSKTIVQDMYASGDPTNEQIEAAQSELNKARKSAELAATMVNAGTAGGPDDLANQVIAKTLSTKTAENALVRVDKYFNPEGQSCSAPKSLNPDSLSIFKQNNAILPPDDGKAIKAIAAGTLNVALATQLACGTSSNPLPADVTAAPISGCTSGTFVCGNGKLICRDKVCNGKNDCGDSSEEGSSMCGAPQSCCQVTNGCPGETGSTCGGTCCCCPYGQACDRVNPGRGCVASN